MKYETEPTRNFTTNKKVATIALVLVLTFATTIVTLPIVSAHGPPWEIPTLNFLAAAPNPIGANQQVHLITWLKYVPQPQLVLLGTDEPLP
jgi:hypothetical protein